MDPDEPPRRADAPIDRLVAEDLDRLSKAELGERIATLESEIARTRARMTRAADHRADADALFRR